MSRIYRALAAWLDEWLRVPDCVRDELPGLSARDWADLPTYHPVEGRPCGC